MSRDNLNAALYGAEIPKESHCLDMSEEAETPEPQRLLSGAQELETNCRTGHQEQSEVRALQSQLKEARAKETHLKEQALTYQEELSKMHGHWNEFNIQLEVKVLEINDLRAEVTRLKGLISENTEIKEELGRVSNLLLKEKKDTHTRKLKEELVLSENKNMTAELARIESLREKQRADIGNLKAEVDYLKALREKEHAEFEQLRAALQGLQDNENLISELAPLFSKKQVENEQLRAAVYELEHRVVEAQQDHREKDELSQKAAQLEHQQKTMQTEKQNLLAEMQDLEERENSLYKQNKTMSAELALLKSQIHIKQSLNEHLMAEDQDLQENVADLKYQLEEAELLIRDKDELIARQNRKLAYEQEIIEEMYVLNGNMKQSICDLRDQLEMNQEEQGLAGDETFREESTTAENGEEQDSPVPETPPEEPREDSLPETPAAEIRSSFWRRSAKGLLKLGLRVGIATVGLLIPVAIVANSLAAGCDTNTTCVVWDRVYHMLEPYSNVHSAVPPPF